MLSRSTGEGHNHVALALRESFELAGHECEVRDALWVGDPSQRDADSGELLSADAAKPSSEADVASRLYGWAALKIPWAFGATYNMGAAYARTRIPSPIRLHNERFTEATHAYIEEHQFDVVVATHTFPMETMAAVRRRYPSSVRYYGVLTDYTCTPFFSEARVDGYFIPHPDMAADCIRQGLLTDRTYALGLPVRRSFREVVDKDTTRTALGLPIGTPLFLIMSGGVGGFYLGRVCDQLLGDGGENTHVVVLTGRREDLFTAIAGKYRVDSRVTVVPFTDRVREYMAAADVMLSKAGAVSSTEAAVAGLPLIHTGAIPGGETKNARFFAEHGMSLYTQNPYEAGRLAYRLQADERQVARMRDHQAKNILPNGADRIVTQVEDIRG